MATSVKTDNAEVSAKTAPAESRADQVMALQKKEARRRRLPLLPALLFTIVVTQVPFLFSLYYSLTEWNLLDNKPREFTGFDNFTGLFSKQGFTDAVVASVTMTVSAVLLSIVVGTGLAILLDRKFFGQGFVRTLLITPFLVMPVVAALVWEEQMLSESFGLVNWLLETIGFDRIPFVTNYGLWSIILVLVWQWSPFMMLIVLAGLQGQDSSVLEAARVDGATPRAIFFQITLPHLRPYIELSILLGAIYLIQVFDHVEVMSGGRPGDQNVPHFVYQRSIGLAFEFGEASAYSVIVVIATIILATMGLRVLSNLFEGEDPA